MPVAPMLAKLARELPLGDYLYEPKWDGLRALWLDGELWSRHGNPLGRYFPELVEALQPYTAPLDGEIVAPDRAFAELMARIHPAASRVELLRRETPVELVVFDLVADAPFAERRAELERLLGDARPPLRLTELTPDPAVAEGWLDAFEGVIAKHRDLPYSPGKRTMIKVKRDRTADCVVAGFRWRADRPLPSSLLLGLYDDERRLEHVGVAASFGVRLAAELLHELEPRIVPLAGHPWEHGFLVAGGAVGRLRGAAGRWLPGMTMDWTPVAPVLVAEVGYDQADAGRFRHPTRFRRWRPDRDPASCTFAQLP
jgi:ATP-dependent DNA ligase